MKTQSYSRWILAAVPTRSYYRTRSFKSDRWVVAFWVATRVVRLYVVPFTKQQK